MTAYRSPMAAIAFAISLPSFVLSLWITDGTRSAILAVVVLGLLAVYGAGDHIRLSPISLVSLAYFLGYPAVLLGPEFLYANIWFNVPKQAIADAAVWSSRGVAALAVGYFFSVLLLNPHPGSNEQSDAKLKHAEVAHQRLRQFLLVLGLLSCTGWVLALASTGVRLTFGASVHVNADLDAGGLGQIWHVLTQLRIPLFAVAYLAWKSRLIDRILLMVLAVTVLQYVFDTIIIGSKGEIMRGVAALVIAISLSNARWNLRLIGSLIAASCAVYFSFSFVGEYRTIIQAEERAGNPSISLAVQSAAISSALLYTVGLAESTDVGQTGEERMSVMLDRYAAPTFSFGNLLEHTATVSPKEFFWESLLTPLYAVLPRAILPDKPIFFNSGRNASEYYNLPQAGISVSLIGSLYYSFGYIGIVIGMLMVGLVFGFLFIRAQAFTLTQPTWFALTAFATVALLDVGGTFHALATNLTRVAIIVIGAWFLSGLNFKARTNQQS